MRPPVFAETLVAACTPRADYESIAGDLHEEYLRHAHETNVTAANRWYWSQTLRSLPSFLSYSRASRSLIRLAGVVLIALAVLVAMLLATIPINAMLGLVFGDLSRCPLVVEFVAYWTDAALFGTLLALIVRGAGIRLAFFTALFFVLCYAIPALIGFPSSQAPVWAWVLLCGTIPAMCAGAGAGQVFFSARSR